MTSQILGVSMDVAFRQLVPNVSVRDLKVDPPYRPQGPTHQQTPMRRSVLQQELSHRAPLQPRSGDGQWLMDQSNAMRADLVQKRLLIQALPGAIERNLEMVGTPIKTLAVGGIKYADARWTAAQLNRAKIEHDVDSIPNGAYLKRADNGRIEVNTAHPDIQSAHTLINHTRDFVNLLTNDVEGTLINMGHLLDEERAHIDRLHALGRAEEAAQRTADLYVAAAAMAAPGVGWLYASGRATLAAGQVAGRVTQLQKIHAKTKQAVDAVAHRKHGVAAVITAGALATAVAATSSSVSKNPKIRIYKSSKIPASFYGAPDHVSKAITVRLGDDWSASFWYDWGGSAVGSGAELRSSGGNNRPTAISEQHQTLMTLGAGINYGKNPARIHSSIMYLGGNTTTTARADDQGRRRSLLGQIDASLGYFKWVPVAVSAGPSTLATGTQSAKKNQAAARLSQQHSGTVYADRTQSNYNAVTPNKAFGRPSLDGYQPDYVFEPFKSGR